VSRHIAIVGGRRAPIEKRSSALSRSFRGCGSIGNASAKQVALKSHLKSGRALRDRYSPLWYSRIRLRRV
jgi:hypothetical protein